MRQEQIPDHIYLAAAIEYHDQLLRRDASAPEQEAFRNTHGLRVMQCLESERNAAYHHDDALGEDGGVSDAEQNRALEREIELRLIHGRAVEARFNEMMPSVTLPLPVHGMDLGNGNGFHL